MPPEDQPTSALYTALAAAQAEFTAITKNKTAKVKTKGGAEYSYKYADLGDVLTSVRPILAKHGLAILQPIRGENLETWLCHVGGESVHATVGIGQSPSDPQSFGAALTYLRRYALTGLLGIATEEDTDAQHVPKGKPAAKAKPVEKPAPAPTIDHKRAEDLIVAANAKNLLDKLPLAAAHARGGEAVPAFETLEGAVTSMMALTVEQADRVEKWIDGKPVAEQEGLPV
jgi:hypothetical protein